VSKVCLNAIHHPKIHTKASLVSFQGTSVSLHNAKLCNYLSVLVLKRQFEGSNASFITNLVVDEKRMRLGHG